MKGRNSMISVIVTVYNEEKYLEQCVESICRQTYKNLEIILVDDGSTDRSAEICDLYAEKDARISVVHKKNGGPVSARKAGLAVSHAGYVTFVDGDDWLEETMYEKLFQCMKEHQVDLAMCGRFEDTEDASKEVFQGAEPGKYEKSLMLEKIYPNMIVNREFFEWGISPSECDKLFKRECIESFQMDEEECIRMGDDAVCTFPCMLKAESVYILGECLYHYRQTTDSLVKTIRNSDLERKQFHAMYQAGMERFTRYRNIYDLRKQWEMYVLFLMIPRSDGLYEGFSRLDYLFPYPKVKRGMKIVLYGAGTYGQRLYQYLSRSRFCEVVLWVDRNYKEFQKMGLSVSSPSELKIDSTDQIVLAITYAKPKKALYRELVKKYGEEKISIINEALILSDASRKAFGISCAFQGENALIGAEE